MSADAWETCPFCHTKESVREDFEIYLSGKESISVYFKAVCRECGIRWETNSIIKCMVDV